ncbi:FtsK/SpoIIIE domain-containing protein [Streptomyces sp. IBSBF 2435]|uniref:FtsK/SpoIIIE domain-containing protein n=1 Tax=Streptomyces sp. IBSBF 2435 TaxID=2903531 RepID=UPI002FDBFA32
MTEIIDLDAHRPRPVPDLTKTATAPDTAPREVLQGVVIPSGDPTVAPGKAPSRPGGSGRVRRAVGVTLHVVTHDRTKTSARTVIRHGAYVAGGAGILARRAWDGRSAARYERMIRVSEAAGQHETAMEWEERGRAFRAARHQRRMDLLGAPQRVAKGAAVATAAGTGGLLGLGAVLAIAEHDPALVIAPVMFTIDMIRWAVVICTIVWGPALVVGPWLAFLGLWNTGRRGQAAPQWALPPAQRSTDGMPITPSIVVTAMRDLGIATLRGAVRAIEDNGAAMLGPIRIAGCGVEVDVTLPSGVSTEEVQGRRRKLAENLGRHEHEVFVSIPVAARTVRLWIADSGALDEPIGPSPLVIDPELSANYATGRAPWGQDLRGDAALISLFQRHLLITGLSNQGKTASLRALVLWLAMDPTVEFRIADLKGIGDWRMMNGLATVLIEGPTDEHVIDATDMLEDGVAEMERRMMAPAGTTWDPLILIVDEAQVAFMCPAVGDDKRPYGGVKATSRYFQAARKIHNQGRAVDVLLYQGTQDPTDQNLPKLVREGAHIRASLVLGTESQARMALGDKAIDGGAAPHKLRQGLDKGTVVVAGDGVKLAPGQSSVTIRTHYIDGDQAAEIAERAKARRDGVTTKTAVDNSASADALADIAAVLGSADRMRTQEVLHGLAQLNPREYRAWAFTDLRDVLDPVGAVRKSDGRMVVDRAKLRDALAQRDTETPES